MPTKMLTKMPQKRLRAEQNSAEFRFLGFLRFFAFFWKSGIFHTFFSV